jgi:hypothetical protein
VIVKGKEGLNEMVGERKRRRLLNSEGLLLGSDNKGDNSSKKSKILNKSLLL